MNEILKQLMERGYGITLNLKDQYIVKNSNQWTFNSELGLTYEKIMEAVKRSTARSATQSQMIMSPKTYKNIQKLLGKK